MSDKNIHWVSGTFMLTGAIVSHWNQVYVVSVPAAVLAIALLGLALKKELGL